jgi:hypothetical protein
MSALAVSRHGSPNGLSGTPADIEKGGWHATWQRIQKRIDELVKVDHPDFGEKKGRRKRRKREGEKEGEKGVRLGFVDKGRLA